MKIGVYEGRFGNGYSRWGDDCYKKMKEHGLSAMDFNMANTDSLYYTLPEDEANAMIRREKELAAEAGIEISQVHGPWRWPAQDLTDEDRAERMEKMKKSIRLTSVLGCKNWVIHPIMPFGIYEINKPEAEQTWQMNLEFMGELLKEAKKYDIVICFENMPMPEFSLGSPEQILKFVKQMNDDNFKICLDTGHVSVYDNLSLADETRRLGKEIRVLHVHDNKVGWDLHLMPYHGIIDWKEFAKSLKDIGYDGVFSLETQPPHALPTPIFEELCKIQVKIANEILGDM